MVELYSSQSRTNFGSQTSQIKTLQLAYHGQTFLLLLSNSLQFPIKHHKEIRCNCRNCFLQDREKVLVHGWHILQAYCKLCFAVKRETNEFRLLFRLFFWFSCACVSFQSVECVIKSNLIIGTTLISPSRKITYHTLS